LRSVGAVSIRILRGRTPLQRASLSFWQSKVTTLKLPRRQFLHLAAGAAALPAVSRIAVAQTYPARPGRLIVGFPAGSSADIAARLMGHWLADRLGQPFVVENRPGAGSNIAAEMVVRAAPDGYTLLHMTATNAINATLYDNLNFNFIRDIEPVAGINRVAYVMEVNPSVPARRFPSSSPTPGPIRARSTWHQVETGPCSMWRASCSR
jgi:hypothetical protein